MTRGEKRTHNDRYLRGTKETATGRLIEEQRADPEVQKWKEQEKAEQVIDHQGLLCRRWHPRDRPEEVIDQVVLPRSYRSNVLRLAHDVPMAGHLGRERTTKRILKRFFWPGLFQDVRKYCESCDACQRVAKKREKVPLIPMPIMDKPFRRIAMDVVGPLPRTRKGNQYILVVCDYATRYPEAFPLRTFTAPTVAEKLIEMFARYGIPEEILTDQGTNFTSQFLQKLNELLGVKAIKTSPYHPQTDGLVERFNQTLKSMLRRVLAGENHSWDVMLPYVLFAYREVPQESTGFSPFELIYSRDVRGPLDVLKESWSSGEKEMDDILTYVMKTRERMELASELAHENLKMTQQKCKQWYDRKAREMELKEGDQVLLLLPDSTKKFQGRWQGPYEVKKRLGKVNYEIMMPERGSSKVVHINLLKKWHQRETAFANVIKEDPGIVDYCWEGGDSLRVGEQLGAEQQNQLGERLKHFPNVTKDQPGQTHLLTHRIPTGTAQPIRLKPYRVPIVYREKVGQELREMERHGIIEKSSSEWAFPIVVVTKKDGDIRICVDYRRLNQVTTFDAYPMPRVDELLDAIGGAAFITTLDLAKGYWQVPLTGEDKAKTAFTTPNGLYQFTVMPFGLSGGPATFQRLMDTVLRGTEKFTGVYLDDVVICSNNWAEHLDHIAEVFKRLQEAGLTVKLKKCTFGAQECTYLGHRIGRGGVQPETSKVAAIREMARPRTKKDVRTFLGMTGYYRRFIKNYASVAEPLTELTRKQQPEQVEWNERTEHAFQRLKDTLTSAKLMKNPDFTQTFILQTDASNVGVGAVLSQGSEEDRPIAYFSRKLLPRERNYSVVEKECLAVVLGIRAFETYLLGKPFVIQTDHRALQWLQRFKDKNARLTRWSLALQPYTFTVTHRKGCENANADALSRISQDPCFALKMEGGNVTEKTGSGSKEITCPDHDRGGPIQILGEKPEAVQPYGSDPGREL